jgi:uncharacterized membrane protein
VPPLAKVRGNLCSAPQQEFQAFGARPYAAPWHIACFSLRQPLDEQLVPSNYADEFVSRESAHELERWAGVAVATAVMAFGLSRRSMPGIVLAAAAAPVAYRTLTGEWPGFSNGAAHTDTRTALSGSRGIHVRESVRLEVPLDEVYAFWRRLENLPRFMQHLESVTELGGGRSRWVVPGPAGATASWDADIINEIPNKVIGWRSIDGSEIATAGSVHFSTARQGRSSQVRVHLQYAAPGGHAGQLLAWALGRDPGHMVREDLRRFKRLLEAGEIPRATRGEDE